MQQANQIQYQCASGVQVRRSAAQVDYAEAMQRLCGALDQYQGVLLASSFEYPGRYTRWDIGFINPPLQFIGRGRELNIHALNTRGEILLLELHAALQNCAAIEQLQASKQLISILVRNDDSEIAEEDRSRRPSLFSVLREIIACFASPEDPYLGLYGAFGYDLTFQFEDVQRFQHRDSGDRELVLFLDRKSVV